MIIPVSTDAPIYHYPLATIGVIGVNLALYVARALYGPDAFEPYLEPV